MRGLDNYSEQFSELPREVDMIHISIMLFDVECTFFVFKTFKIDLL